MTTKTIKLNAATKVGQIVYWNITGFPCAMPFTVPTHVSDKPQTWACPPGKWVNPGGTNKNLTLVCLSK